ncbi:MAG: toll/interleukin-1 receptor domain-containing protein [Gaiellaceae bacterium]
MPACPRRPSVPIARATSPAGRGLDGYLRPLEAARNGSYTQSDPESCGCHGKAGRTSEIFISYRREDAPAHAGRLYDRLAEEFGDEQVFMDVDALEPGADFVQRIRSAVGSADALLVVIGRGWLEAKTADGERRLDDPQDFVRLEIALALSGDAVVIPVLVGGAVMPAEEDLPPDLARLARRHALTLIDADWRSGEARLVSALRRIVEPVEEPVVGPPPPVEPSVKRVQQRSTRIPAIATALGLAGAVALVAGTWLQADLWAHPELGLDRDGLGYFGSVAPMTIAVAAVGSLLLSYSRAVARLATGLLLGFALAGVARYLDWLGVFSAREDVDRFVVGVWIALAGCVLLAVAALVRISAEREQRDPVGVLVPRLLVIAGAALVAVATVVPFTSEASLNAQTVFDRGRGWHALEPIGSAACAVAVSFFLAKARVVASGALIALGSFLSLLWAARYIAFPAWQVDDVGSLALGGFLGLAGGLAILAGGLSARRPAQAYSPALPPAASSSL